MYSEAEFCSDDRREDDQGPWHIRDVLAELLSEIEMEAAEEPVAAA